MGSFKKAKLLATASVAGAMGLFGFSYEVKATPATWTSGSGSLATGANWSTGSVPTGDIATFNAGNISLSPSADGGVSFLGVNIANSSAGNYNFVRGGAGAQSLTLGASGLTATGNGTIDLFFSTVIINAAQDWNIDTDVTVTQNNVNGLTLNNQLTKTGNGTLFFVKNSSGAGGISVSAGTLTGNNTASAVWGTGNVSIGSGGTVEGRNVVLSFPTLNVYSGGTVLGTGTGGGIGSAITLGSIGGNVSFNTGASSTDVLATTSSINGGDSTNIINIGGSGTVILKGGSVSSNAFDGTWVVPTGTFLKVYDVAGLGNRTSVGFASVKLAGGTLLAAGINSTGAVNFGSSVTVTGNSTILIDRQTSAGVAISNANARAFGTLTIGTNTLNVGNSTLVTAASSSGASMVSFTSATLLGNATFNVFGGNATTYGLSLGVVNDGGNGYSVTKTGTGLLNFSAVPTYTGATTVTGGMLNYGSFASTQSTSRYVLANDAIIQFNNGLNNTWIVNKPVSGNGTLVANGASRATLSAAGGTLSPGSGNTVGTLTLIGGGSLLNAVAWGGNSSVATTINIDVVGTGANDYDKLVLNATSFVGDFGNTTLNINTAGLNHDDFIDGHLLTIVSTVGANFNFATLGYTFTNVVDSSGWNDKVYYLNGSIAIALPEPSSAAGLGLLALGALRRRRRRRLIT